MTLASGEDVVVHGGQVARNEKSRSFYCFRKYTLEYRQINQSASASDKIYWQDPAGACQ